MSKRRRYFPSEQEKVADAEEQILEDAISKTAEVKENYIPKEPRIPSMLKEPPKLEKTKRRVKSHRLRLRKEPSRIGDIVTILKQDDVIDIDISYKNPDWEKVVDESGNERGYVMKIYISPYE